MVKQIINIICIPILYNILDEIKDNLSFKVENFNNEDEFLKFLNENKTDHKKSVIITTIHKKNFLLKKNFNLKNIFFFFENNSEQNFNQNYNIFKYPIDIYNLIEKINIQLIKQKYDFQSKIKLKNYSLDLNSRTITKNSKKLKLTEREMDIILFLNDSKKPQKINILQNQVWKYLSKLETHTVETHIYRLRKKMNDNFKDDNFIISSDSGYFIK
jgi:DNA-binding CsgD family transcriptional regulator